MSRPRNAKRLELIHLEDRTVPSSVPVPMAIPPIGTPGGALAAENDFTDTDGNAPVQIHVLGNDGQYVPSPHSACLPFVTSDELNRWIYPGERTTEMKLRRKFLTWVEQSVRPRLGN